MEILKWYGFNHIASIRKCCVSWIRNMNYTYRKFLTFSSMNVLQYIAIQRKERKKNLKVGSVQLFILSETAALNTACAFAVMCLWRHRCITQTQEPVSWFLWACNCVSLCVAKKCHVAVNVNPELMPRVCKSCFGSQVSGIGMLFTKGKATNKLYRVFSF